MSLLCPFQFPAGAWCRLGRVPGRVVLWLPPVALPLGFAPWFLASGGRVVASQSLSGGVAFCLAAPDWVLSALLGVVPPPVSHGSQTAGVLLPF